MKKYHGLAASRGIAIGPIFQFRRLNLQVERHPIEDAEAEWHRLLEALCEKIAERALRLDAVCRVRVAARKPHAPIEGPLDSGEVVLERETGDG